MVAWFPESESKPVDMTRFTDMGKNMAGTFVGAAQTFSDMVSPGAAQTFWAMLQEKDWPDKMQQWFVQAISTAEGPMKNKMENCKNQYESLMGNNQGNPNQSEVVKRVTDCVVSSR